MLPFADSDTHISVILYYQLNYLFFIVPHPEGYSRPGPSHPAGPAQEELSNINIKHIIIKLFLIDITHMDRILEVLKEAMFDATNWQSLGFSLGLYMPTLNVISRTIGNADDHLMQTIQKWLQKKDGVIGTTWQILIDAVEMTGDIVAAERISTILESHNIVKTQDDEKGNAVPPIIITI